MATLAFDSSVQPTVPATDRPRQLSFSGLLKEIRRYLWRYGTVTDIETDPIELLQHAYKALDEQERAFENENAQDSTKIEQLEKELAATKAELAATKAKLPPWWKG